MWPCRSSLLLGSLTRQPSRWGRRRRCAWLQRARHGGAAPLQGYLIFCAAGSFSVLRAPKQACGPAFTPTPACLPCYQALDLVLHTAAQHGVRLALVLGTTDSAIGQGGAGTPATYMQWVSGSLNLTGVWGRGVAVLISLSLAHQAWCIGAPSLVRLT